MINFLFKKDLWISDSIVSLIFSVFIGYLTLVNSVTGERDWVSILDGTTAYIITFALALYWRKKFVRLRSWMWMGIIGALVRIIILQATSFPKILDYHRKFSPNTLDAALIFFSDALKITFFNWLLWAAISLVFIFALRFLLYAFFKLFAFRHWQSNIIQAK